MVNHTQKLITWIELLPTDVIQHIRFFLAKHDFKNVLNQLEVATHSERQWILECARLEFLHKEGRTSVEWQYSSTIFSYCNRYVPAYTPSIQHVKNVIYDDFFTDGFSYRPADISHLARVNIELAAAFDNYDVNYHSNSPIFMKIWQFIEYHIAIIHQIIENIRKSYATVAVPVEFIKRTGVPLGSCWPDTKEGFIRYVNQDNAVSSYRYIINKLLEKINYNCGHLRAIRYSVNHYKQCLFRVNFN